MSSLEIIAVILQLIKKLNRAGSWCGETHIQKSLYFLKELTEAPFEFDFILYKHGPYSFELHDELVSINADGLLGLEPMPAPYGPSWIVTDSGERIIAKLKEAVLRLDSAIDFICDKLGEKTVAELERLGTALMISKGHWSESVPMRAKQLCSLKPHIVEERAISAIKTIDELRLEWANSPE